MNDQFIDPKLPPARYARRVLEVFGPVVRLSQLAKADIGRWPGPITRMNELCRLGMADRVMIDGRLAFFVDPPAEPRGGTYRHKVKITFGPRLLPRAASSALYPKLGQVSAVRPGWQQEVIVVKYVAKVPGGWFVKPAGGG